MQAIRLNQWGQPLQLEEIAQPTPSDGQVLVKVRASSINPVDRYIALGYLESMLSTPMTPGTDFAGEVVEVGAGVSHVQVGDGVYGFIPYQGGAFAEYVVANAEQVARKPETLDWTEAAGVPLVAVTAWQALFDVAELKSGERLLVHGAAGSVGSFAVQFAKEKGATVLGTAAGESDAFLRDLGIDEYINYEAQSFEEVAQGIDVVFDTVGKDTLERSYSVLKPGGRLVTVAGQPSDEKAQEFFVSATSFSATPTVERLTAIAELIDAGKVKVFVNRTFPLAEAQAALDASAQPHTRGKIIVTVP